MGGSAFNPYTAAQSGPPAVGSVLKASPGAFSYAGQHQPIPHQYHHLHAQPQHVRQHLMQAMPPTQQPPQPVYYHHQPPQQQAQPYPQRPFRPVQQAPAYASPVTAPGLVRVPSHDSQQHMYARLAPAPAMPYALSPQIAAQQYVQQPAASHHPMPVVHPAYGTPATAPAPQPTLLTRPQQTLPAAPPAPSPAASQPVPTSAVAEVAQRAPPVPHAPSRVPIPDTRLSAPAASASGPVAIVNAVSMGAVSVQPGPAVAVAGAAAKQAKPRKRKASATTNPRPRRSSRSSESGVWPLSRVSARLLLFVFYLSTVG